MCSAARATNPLVGDGARGVLGTGSGYDPYVENTGRDLQTPSADDPVLIEVVRRLSEVYHPLRIYLFGSTARGDAGPDSDYDLMVILPDKAHNIFGGKNPDTALFVEPVWLPMCTFGPRVISIGSCI